MTLRHHDNGEGGAYQLDAWGADDNLPHRKPL